jgi:DNA-binding ferritin-like protein
MEQAEKVRNKGGRPKGSRQRVTKFREELIARKGLTPLEYLLDLMKDQAQPADVRMDAAKAAAPYVHPKLNAMAANITQTDDIRAWMVSAREAMEE